ncbi:MAG: YbjQ family protein [Daejeonella sp.]|uniref:YbjQ family protein n=1 Tax=Daejeonella sp. TaxID=2805397 RepID=UPI003C73A6D9
MATPKDILVVTSSTLDGVKIKRYLKPVSAHIVAGTNLFSDFMGGLTDVFGGRSQSYQKQLASLYNEAISRIKHSAHEIGANCVIGLSIDMDEISGKGKSMFMLTAIGTAVILEKESIEKIPLSEQGPLENVGVDRINTLRQKKSIIKKANDSELQLTEDTWGFITENQIHEVFPFLVRKLEYAVKNEISPGDSDAFYKFFVGYMDRLPESIKLQLLYDSIKVEAHIPVILKLGRVVKELHLFDAKKTFELLKNEDFTLQKRGLRLTTFDKPFYNKQDMEELKSIITFVQNNFKERGTRTLKKDLYQGKRKFGCVNVVRQMT